MIFPDSNGFCGQRHQPIELAMKKWLKTTESRQQPSLAKRKTEV